MNSTQVPVEPVGRPAPALLDSQWLGKAGRPAAWLILLVALGLRLYRLPYQSIWWDEGHSLFVASHNLPTIPTIPAMDVHPPLYFWLLHLWIDLAGTSEFATRFLSLIFGVVTVALMYKVGRELFGEAGGWVAALLAAMSPLYLAYSQEVRMYTLVGMLSLLSIYLFYRYMRADSTDRGRRLLPYALATAAGLYAHYFFGFLLVFENLYWLGALLFDARWRERKEWIRWAAGQALVVLLMTPQIFTAMRQVTSYKNTNLIAPRLMEFLASNWRAFTLGVNGGRESLQANAQVWMIGVLGILLAGLLARYIPRPDRKIKLRWIVLWLSAFLLPLALYYLVLLDRASFSPRYMIIVTPALYMLLAYSVWQLGRRWVPLGVCALALLSATFVVADGTYFFDPAYAKDDTRDLAHFLGETVTSDDVAFIDVPHPLDYYYEGDAPQSYLFVDINTIASVLTENSQGKERLFFIRWRQSDTDPRGAVLYLLDKHGVFRGRRDFRGYRVVWYDLPDPVLFDLPTELEPTSVSFGDRIALTGGAFGGKEQGTANTGYEVQRPIVPAGSTAWVTLQWRIPDGTCESEPCLQDDYKVALYLEDDQGHRVGQVDKELLNDRHLRTSGWDADDVALNVYTLPVASGTPPGEHRITATVYRTEDGTPLSVIDEGGAPQGIGATIGTVQVVRPDEAPDLPSLGIRTPVEQTINDDIVLLGYDVHRRSVNAGTDLPLSLYWQARRTVDIDYQVQLRLFDADGTVEEEIVQTPVNGTYPTTQWTDGEVLRDQIEFPIPASLAAGDYELRVGLLASAFPDSTTEIPLGSITVEGRPHRFDIPAIANSLEADFGGKIRLLGYDLAEFAPPHMTVTLYWRALEEMDTSYKVFTHLLGPDGEMWGQKDDLPGAGSLPTTGWIAGEVISDQYEIELERGAPPGVYQLLLGFYDPRSGERLSVTDDSGTAAGDSVEIPDIVIVP